MMALAKRKVVIVGAGIAGLTAGAELCRSGQFEVTILEAMATCGGRIQTVKGFGSRSIELGANWLHGTKGSPVYDLAKKHDLLYTSDGNTSSSSSSSSSSISSSIFDEEDAKWYTNNSAAENQHRTETGECIDAILVQRAKKMFADAQNKQIYEINQSEMDNNQNVGDATTMGFAEELKRRGVVSGTKEYGQHWLMYEHCCRMECLDIGSDTLSDAQLKTYGNYEELEGSYYTTLGYSGYQGVLDKLLDDIPAGSIHYNTPVESIQYAGCDATHGDVAKDGEEDAVVMVMCEDGRTFSCSHVIMTASVGFLKDNVETFFKPPLPEDKVHVFRTLPYGTVNKMFLKYKNPFWKSEEFGLQTLWKPLLPNEEESETEGKEKFYRMMPGFDVEDKNEDILVGWTYGKGADYMETLTDEEIGQRCTAILRKFMNDPSIPEPDEVLCTRWHSNRFQRGAYGAFLPLRATGKEFAAIQSPVYSNTTRHGKKVPVLLFAGEAFHKRFFSTTHGAMSSGKDQAKVLIDFSSVKDK